MNRRIVFAASVIVAGLAIWAIFALRSSENGPAPPLTGAMADFTPTPDAGPAPQNPLVARDGTTRRLADYRGRVVLVNFWATWCAPCVREMPSLLRLQQARGGADFTVLAVSQDLKGWEAIAPFIAEHGLSGLPVLHDPKGALARALGVTGLPATVLIGRDGRVRGRLVGPASWDGEAAKALVDFHVAAGAPDR